MNIRMKIFVLSALVFCACSQNKKNISYPSLPDYDLANPVMVHLRTELDEISGVTYYPKDSSIFAINDELGLLYKIYVRHQVDIKKWKFSGGGDYEDLALVDSTFYALQSNGQIKSFRFASKDSIVEDDCQLPIMGSNDFETLYYDEENGKLVLICKTCEMDNKKTITAYSFNPADETFSESPYFTIDASEVARQLPVKNVKFKPSAAAIHPITKDLYIISSVAKAIVVAGRDGKIKEAYQIDPVLFKQPEGMTFTSSGDLIICNESAGLGAPNILLFKYKPLVHEKG